MRAKTKCLLLLSIFAIVDFLPFPVLPVVMIIVTLSRPRWFKRLIDRLYSEP